MIIVPRGRWLADLVSVLLTIRKREPMHLCSWSISKALPLRSGETSIWLAEPIRLRDTGGRSPGRLAAAVNIDTPQPEPPRWDWAIDGSLGWGPTVFHLLCYS